MDALYRTACRLTARRSEAEDLVQETMLEAYRGFSSLAAPHRCRAWLFRILRNRWFHHRKRERARATDELDLSRAPAGDLDHELHALGFSDDVERALQAVPEEFRTALLLVTVEELTYDEVAEVMQCPIGTVRSRVARARALLSAALVTVPLAAARRGRP